MKHARTMAMIAATLLIMLVGGWLLLRQVFPGPPKAVLLRGLVATVISGESDILTRRLRARFPSGVTETALIESLARDGFGPQAGPQHIARPSSEPPTPVALNRSTSVTWTEGARRMEAEAAWRVDGAGKVADLTGFVAETCP